MIVKIPHQFIRQDNPQSFRECYVNASNINWVEVTKFIYTIKDEIVENYNATIVMNGGFSPMLKNMNQLEFQEFILWWNKTLALEKLSYDSFMINEVKE